MFRKAVVKLNVQLRAGGASTRGGCNTHGISARTYGPSRTKESEENPCKVSSLSRDLSALNFIQAFGASRPITNSDLESSFMIGRSVMEEIS